jgi:hypothetical protein
MKYYECNKIHLSDWVILLTKKRYNTERDSSKRRPVAVTIIAILSIIVGIPYIVSGLAPLAVAAFVPELSTLLRVPELSILHLVTGGVLIAIGIGFLVVSYGLLKGRGWAWTVTLILSYIGIVTSIIAIVGGRTPGGGEGGSLLLGHLVISIAIIYFLYRPQSKAFFGKPPNAKI